jgi:hypothetical protein
MMVFSEEVVVVEHQDILDAGRGGEDGMESLNRNVELSEDSKIAWGSSWYDPKPPPELTEVPVFKLLRTVSSVTAKGAGSGDELSRIVRNGRWYCNTEFDLPLSFSCESVDRVGVCGGVGSAYRKKWRSKSEVHSSPEW